ncbi:hypothetical protein [Rhodobacter sp. SY28-1]|uniref:hypothetical protein n=1 Tax=Rhodobacter sp. SY28-1 TaxID=2562317 RepID=UPI0010BF8C5A|nr:hypothetical protein [Rhodobacter sp. SY28-1]
MTFSSQLGDFIRGIRRPLGFVAVSAVLTAVIFWSMRHYFLDQVPLALINARSNYITFEIQRDTVSKFLVHDAEVIDPTAFCEGFLDANNRFTGLVAPRKGTKVSYMRHRSHLQITLDTPDRLPTPELSVKSRPDCRMSGQRLVLLVPQDRLNDHQPFPIIGRGEIGAELANPGLPVTGDDRFPANAVRRAPGPLLFGATVRLFGRTATLLDDGELYPISGAEFIVPRGSRLATNNVESTLVGTVMATGEDEALDIEVTVEATELQLYRVGAGSQVESLGAGAVARAFGNPALVSILTCIAIFSFLVQTLCALAGLIPEKQKRR